MTTEQDNTTFAIPVAHSMHDDGPTHALLQVTAGPTVNVDVDGDGIGDGDPSVALVCVCC